MTSTAPALLPAVSLSDKYTNDAGRIYLTGSQALVRLLMVQRRRDLAEGLNTAGFISGYRGSPMTAIDQELWRAEDLLKEHEIRFWPGINENLAMTAVWGSQQVGFFKDAKYDGVFSMWYGKGPGLDQTLDGLRQANLHGTTKHGGALVLVGDDPEMRSTVDPYHSELLFEDLLMPVLYPADIQEVFDLGVYGIAMSRFCGAFVGYKLLPETIETAASINADHGHIEIKYPDFAFPPDGVNARPGDHWTLHEPRIRRYKLPAALAFARANKLNRISHPSPKPRFGIAAMGKAWRDVQQALLDLGISEAQAADLGITILKIAMPFPADTELYRDFAKGLDEVLVVEDKREQIEDGIRRACYDLPESERPKIVGRLDESGVPLVPNVGELTPDMISKVIAARIKSFHDGDASKARLAFLKQKERQVAKAALLGTARTPYFCSGCPHNTSTKVPEGSVAFGGVGCHFMANWMDRDVYLFTHMGGEGAQWIGQAPFVEANHTFQQLGDGTYFHSGSLAIRAAVSSGENITYKILFNDAVAMTGGQPIDGQLNVPQITSQMRLEGIDRIAVVTDEPEKYRGVKGLAKGTSIHHRRELDAVQREMREISGVSILIYDQTCAAEKRRRRKRGTFPDPAKRAFINHRVCEGCGDCSQKSNCLSVQPVDTEFGRKRQIHQSSCNKDFSCVDGFCPSFVTVHGGDMRKGAVVDTVDEAVRNVPDPVAMAIPQGSTYGVLIGGVGGTGVITIGALLGMAGHLDGKGVSIVDQMGFAQKGGPVQTHIRFANTPGDINTARLNAGATDLLIGCDMLVAGGDGPLKTLQAGRTRAILNLEENMSGDFIQNPDLRYPTGKLETRFAESLNPDDVDFLEASKIAVTLLGDAIGANLFLTGFAWQKGLVPLSEAAILRAIDLNGVKPDWNKKAFRLGRLAAHQPDAVAALMTDNAQTPAPALEQLDDIIAHRKGQLTAYQNEAYASRYETLVRSVESAEAQLPNSDARLATAVARYLYKLMAYKDEYEVARLQTDPDFKARLEQQFEGDYKVKYHLSPPLLAQKDKITGRPRKYEFGGWVRPIFVMLAKAKGLRGTRLDLFGWTAERKMERRLIADYEAMLETALSELTPKTYDLAVQLAELPDQIRGFGYIKEDNVAAHDIQRQTLLDTLLNPSTAPATLAAE